MKRGLRVVALLLGLGVIAAWALLGAHRGWSRTSIPEVKIDSITELEFTEYRQQFQPGVDFLAAGTGAALALAAISFFIPNRRGNTSGRDTPI